MANITLYVPDSFKKRLDEHPDANWSGDFRALLEKRLADLEEMDRLAQYSNLTEEDVVRLAAEVNAAGGRHALALLAAHDQKRGRKTK